MKEHEPLPCVGCGYCCKKAPCRVAYLFVKDPQPPCPLLVFKEGRYWCQAILDAPPESELRLDVGGIGAGCSSSLFNQDRDRILRQLNS